MSALLYIHGFAGSPDGVKGQLIQKKMAQLGLLDQLRAPALLMEPFNAIQQLEEAIQDLKNPTLVGNSLGGYYATYLAEKHQLKALLINPVVLPHRWLAKAMAEQQHYSSKDLWAIKPVGNILRIAYNSDQTLINNYIQELAALEVAQPKDPTRYKVFLKTGDEVLDYRYAQEWYQGCDVRVDQGGDHGFADFDKLLPNILAWANL